MLGLTMDVAEETTSQFLARIHIQNAAAEQKLNDEGYDTLAKLKQPPPSFQQLKEYFKFNVFQCNRILKELQPTQDQAL